MRSPDSKTWARSDVISTIAAVAAAVSLVVSIWGNRITATTESFESTPALARICRLSNLNDFRRPVDQSVFLLAGNGLWAQYPIDGVYSNGYSIPKKRRFLECTITNDGRLAIVNAHILMPILWDPRSSTELVNLDILEIPALAVGQSYSFDVVNLTGHQINLRAPQSATALTGADIAEGRTPESLTLYPSDPSILFNWGISTL
jgi:hypothetical protein